MLECGMRGCGIARCGMLGCEMRDAGMLECGMLGCGAAGSLGCGTTGCGIGRSFAPYDKFFRPRIIRRQSGHTPSATGGDRVDVHDGVRPLRPDLGRAEYAPLRRVRRHGVPGLPAGPGLPRGTRPRRSPAVILKRRRTNIPAIREMVNGYSSWARRGRAPFFWAGRDLSIPVRPKSKAPSARQWSRPLEPGAAALFQAPQPMLSTVSRCDPRR